MLSDDDIYNIPSVPKFADLRRVGQGESANDSDRTIGDGYFDVSGVIVGSVSSAVPNAHHIVKRIKEESTHGSNKENEPAQKKQEDSDESMFGLAKLAMFRPPKQQRRAMSTEPALVKQNHEDGHRPVRPRASSTDASRQRNAMPSNNHEVKQRIPVRRSVPAVLHPLRHDRMRYPSGDAHTHSIGKDSGLTEIRRAKPVMGTARSAAIQHRLQLADPGAYHGPQTRARAMLDKRTITSMTDVNVVEQREFEKKPQVAGKTENEQEAVFSTASIHRRSALGLAQASTRKDGAPVAGVGVPENQSQAIGVNVVEKGESKSTSATGGGHVPRDRTRRNPLQQKGPVRMMRVSTTSSKGLPSIGSERRFRESVTRRERGGESLERQLNTEQNQVKQVIPKQFHNPKTLLPKEQKRVIGCASGNLSKPSTRRSENRPQIKMARRMPSLDRAEASKTGQVGEEGPAKTFHRRPSSHLTEAEREALFKRLSTPRNVIAKNAASATGGTPKKPSVKTTAKPDGKRSRSPVPAHPATRGLCGPVRRPRSNPGSQHSSRPGSAIGNEGVDQQGPSGVAPQSTKTKSAKGSNEASRVKQAGHKLNGGRGDMGGRAEVGISSTGARKPR